MIFSAPAWAQGGNTITIIHDDGSQDVIDLGEGALSQKAEKAVKSTPVVETVPDDEATSEPEPEVEAEIEPARASEPEPESKIEPKSEPVAESEQEQPKTSAKASVVMIPLPDRKPPVPAGFQVSKPSASVAKPNQTSPELEPEVEQPQQQNLSVAGVITRDQALSIALDAAPPSRDVEIREQVLESGDAVYAVLFKTERGVYEVLVGRVSGEIYSAKMLRASRVPAKPGHLPARGVVTAP